MGMADKVLRLRIRANADIPRDAEVARKFGAEGIGLCRTEHMFFAEDRLPHVQKMILANTEPERREHLSKLLPFQRADFEGLFGAMDGLAVTIRLLDPPLHEFLPKREELMVDVAVLRAKNGPAKDRIEEKDKVAPARWKHSMSSTRCWDIAAAVWGSPTPKSRKCNAARFLRRRASFRRKGRQ